MTPGEWLALAAGGALGAGLRYVVDDLVMKGRRDAFPLGLLVVNVTGSFAAGVLLGLGALVAPLWTVVLGVGLLGGYTTFSTVFVDAALLARRGRRDWGRLNLFGTLVLTLVAAALGLLVGGLFPG